MMHGVILGSLLLLLLLLVYNKIRPALLFSSVAVLYYIFGFISFEKWVNNYVNEALVALVLLLLISVTLEKTHFVKDSADRLISKNYSYTLFKIGLFTSIFSAFLNNTAVVASLIGSIKDNKFHKPSKLLIPLSYCAIFGGTMTLIGTSTNLIVNGFIIETGLEPLGIFDFFYVGSIITLSALFTLILFRNFLPSYNVKRLNVANYFIETRVVETSRLIGKTVQENGLRHLETLFLVELQRNTQLIAPVSPDEVIQAGDVLIFSGDVKQIEILKKFDGLNLTHEKLSLESNLVEVIVSSESTLLDEKVKNTNFRSKFDAAIVAYKRGSEDIKKIGETIVHAGDRLVLAVGHDFQRRDNISKNFYVLSSITKQKRYTLMQSIIIAGLFMCSILLAAAGVLTLVKSLLLLLGVFIILKYLRFDEIKRRFPYEIVLIVGSSLTIASVMVDTGLAGELAKVMNVLFNDYGVYGSFIGIFITTCLLTEVITNNAAAALSFPIAYATAVGLEVSPIPFFFAVAYGASASFLSPYGFQTNVMVNSIGGYKFTDFTKIGLPVAIVYGLVVVVAVPIFFPFK